MNILFYNCQKLGSLDLSQWSTPKLRDMQGTFSGCSSLASLDVHSFDVSKVSYMSNLFKGCSSLKELNLAGWNTPSTSGFDHMFEGCSSLASLDISSLDTSKALNNARKTRSAGTAAMFDGCTSLKSIKLGRNFTFGFGYLYNKRWEKVLVDNKLSDSPTGWWTHQADTQVYALNASDLQQQYKGSVMAGEWTWGYLVHYEPNTNAPGGVEGKMQDGVACLGKLTFPDTTWKNKGYRLKGWSSNADGSGVTYAPGETISIPLPDSGTSTSTQVLLRRAPGANLPAPDENGMVTFYAQWEPISYAINYDMNDAAGSTRTKQVDTENYTMPDLPEEGLLLPDANRVSRFGYRFLGWKDAAEPDGDYVVSVPQGSTGDKTFITQWAPISYKVSFNANGGAGPMDAIEMVFDQKGALPTCTFTRKGYHFGGWARSSTGAAELEDKAETTGLLRQKTGEDDTAAVTLYATWLPASYPIPSKSSQQGNESKVKTATSKMMETTSAQALPQTDDIAGSGAAPAIGILGSLLAALGISRRRHGQKD